MKNNNEKSIESLIKEFNDNDLKNIETVWVELNKKRNEFVNNYSIKVIKNLTKEDYCVGLGNENRSFCYRLENELKPLGDIHGSTSYKFGLYYDKEEYRAGNKSIQFAKHWGQNEDVVFENVKNNIIELIKAGEVDNYTVINKNKISPMLKGKILATYYPEKYLCIFSEEHLDYFLEYLDIKTEKTANIITKQKALTDWKKESNSTKQWNNYTLMRFFYEKIGKPYSTPESEKKGVFNKESRLVRSVNKEKFSNIQYFEYKPQTVKKAIPEKVEGKVLYPRRKEIALNALARAKYQCEIKCGHKLFERACNHLPYTEPHHLIPMSAQKDFDWSLDVEANIVSLCSSCHNQIHYGKDAKELIKKLWEERKNQLKECGIEITLEKLIHYYKNLKEDDE